MRNGDDLPSEIHLVICEGAEDRAFWNGLLKARGWDRVKAKTGRDAAGRKGVKDGRGQDPGQPPYTLGTPDRPDAAERPYVELRPSGGYGDLERTLHNLLVEDRPTNLIREVLLNFDTDLSDEDIAKGRTGKKAHTVAANLRSKGLPAKEREDGGVNLADADCRITLVPWDSPGETRPGVPEKRTLERLVCDALAAARPEWAASVEAWLASRGVDPAAEPHRHKSAALSYYAGWYPKGGSFAFYEQVWGDPPVAAELERLLTQSGAWAAVGRLLGAD